MVLGSQSSYWVSTVQTSAIFYLSLVSFMDVDTISRLSDEYPSVNMSQPPWHTGCISHILASFDETSPHITVAILNAWFISAVHVLLDPGMSLLYNPQHRPPQLRAAPGDQSTTGVFLEESHLLPHQRLQNSWMYHGLGG